MKASRSVKWMLGFLFAGFLMAVCAASMGAIWLIGRHVLGEQATDSELMLNRIAFVGNDGNLWLAPPDGAQLQHLTTAAQGVRFPTWSPNGRRLAFIAQDEGGNAALYVVEGSRSEPRVLFTSPDSAPFYVYWSPDSRSVTFLTQEPSSLAMRLADAANPGSARVMAEGSPFYWAWSPEGDQLFMHVGGAGAISENAHLSFLENSDDAQRVELKLAPGNFQAPVWSMNGEFVAYIAANDSGDEAIYRTDVATDRLTVLTSLDGPTFMVLSPDDQHIAYLEVRQDQQFPIVGSAYIVDTQGGNKRTVLRNAVAAMYWSPDGKKLALLTPTEGDEAPVARVPGLAAPLPQRDGFRWWVYDVETEALELLTTFVPTVEFLQTVPFFDQYHLSLTFWSPDSRYLVITEGNASSSNGTVWILDTTGHEAPRKIGDGTFAVWSWQ